VFFAFDLPHFGGYDLTRVPLVERRALLEKIFAKDHSPRFASASIRGRSKALLGRCVQAGPRRSHRQARRRPYTSPARRRG
jgi:ATP-dependent DNA ligase